MTKARRLVKILFFAWVAIWVLYIVRPFFKNDLLQEYLALARLSVEGKREFRLGKALYDFIRYCDSSVAKGSTYRVIGLDKSSIQHRMVVYLLYPDIPSDDPEYLLVFSTPDFRADGYEIYKTLNPDVFILRKMAR